MYYIASTDNAKIAVYDLNPEKTKTILLVHGWPLNHTMFEYQVNILAQMNYRVITIDIRGFGRSDVTAYGYNYNQLATDLYCVITQLDLRDITLVGFSMGGAIVTRYMSMYKSYGVSKLCYWDAAVPSYSKTIHNPYGKTKEDTDKFIRLGYKNRPELNKYFGSIFFAQQHTQAIKDWFQQMSNSASSIGQMQTLKSLRDEDVFSDLAYIYVPTGIFHGKQDKICSYEMAKIQKENIQYSKLYTFEKSGHGAFYDELELFNKTFIHFLEDDFDMYN